MPETRAAVLGTAAYIPLGYATTYGRIAAAARTEARGFTEEKTLEVAGGLVVTPVEWVIRKAIRDGIGSGAQLSLW